MGLTALPHLYACLKILGASTFRSPWDLEERGPFIFGVEHSHFSNKNLSFFKYMFVVGNVNDC